MLSFDDRLVIAQHDGHYVTEQGAAPRVAGGLGIEEPQMNKISFRGVGHSGASGYRRIPVVLVTIVALALGACSGDPKDAGTGDANSTTAPQGGSYSTQAFIMPFDVMVPDLLPTEATTDTATFVSWETGTQGAPAVRFLLPVNVYVPGDTEASPPPDDYLTYLLGQSEDGATFSDQSETTVDGLPATLVTATVQDSLDGSLGCPQPGIAYTQMVVDGWQIVAQANGQTFDYRGSGNNFRLCPQTPS